MSGIFLSKRSDFMRPKFSGFSLRISVYFFRGGNWNFRQAFFQWIALRPDSAPGAGQKIIRRFCNLGDYGKTG